VTAAQLDEALSREARDRRNRLDATQRFQRRLGVVLAVIALAAALGVAWLGHRVRVFARQAEERRLELERATEGRARLMRGISHDLQNPLGAIDGHAAVLEAGLRGELTPGQRESVGRIRRSVRSLLILINDLLELWRAEAGQISIQLRRADLADVVHDVVEEHRAAAEAAGLDRRLHADQLSNLHGAALAARHRALSADHLEHTDEAGATAMAAAGTVAVLLPGAFYFLRETTVPPVGLFRRHGVRMAVATDMNPGSSPLTSVLLAMNMAATLFRLTVEECLAGVTREAARALGLLDRLGTLEAGKACDLAVWDVERPAELVYRIGFNPLHRRVWRGE
jgi:hypothetical protein